MTHELQVGDILVGANGQEVESALSFTLGPAFPGGFIEVLRGGGQHIRVDGFEQGLLGILLEDIAADSP